MNSRFLVTACAFAAAVSVAAPSWAADAELEKVTVTGKRAHRVSKGATGLAMEIKDTPQTISTIDSSEMSDFGLNGSNAALSLATGINVEQYETNRASFNSRGFDIQLTQMDGLGMTNSWGTVAGNEDTFLFERIELIRGANGLLTGVGNASGTINYVRKRPKNEDSGEVGVSFGSWGLKRAELDYNKVLTKDGSWAGRLVVAAEDSDSYIRDLHNKRNTIYGVVDGQIGENGVLTVGLTAVDAKQSAPMWGSLTLLRADGKQADFPVGSSTSANWTYWNTKSYNAFAEYTHRLADNWEAKLTYNVRHSNDATKLLYAYSNTGTLNADNTGLVGWPYRSMDSIDDAVLDASVNGQFTAFGRKHTVLFGVSRSHEKTAVDTFAVQSHFLDPLPAFPYDGNAYTEPQWGPRAPATRGEQTLLRFYGATRLALTDSLKAIVGVNAVKLSRSGAPIYGNPPAAGMPYDDLKKVSPYAGLTYDFTPDVLGYVSYSDIFQNQDQVDQQGRYLAPAKGSNAEIGVKAEWLNKALLTTAAVFSAKQNGLATYAGQISAPGTPLDGTYWYLPMDVKSKGFELEATGSLAKDTKLTVGYTHLNLTGPDGKDTYEWVPRNTFNFRFDTRLSVLPAVRLGVGGRWQSEESKIGSVTQSAYLVANAFASYDVNKDLSVKLNVNNLFDKKYVMGLQSGALYGAPRNYGVSLDYKL